MRDANESDFETKVIQRSHQVPVVVDFWAEWCGPCRSLGPVIEREVDALGGKVELVKVDTDSNQALAQRYQIRGIPAVKAFRDGKIVSEFVGAQPAPMVRQFLAALAPSETELASEQALADAIDLLQKNRADELEPLLQRVDPRGPLAYRAEALRQVVALGQAARDFGGEDKARAALAQDEANLEARYALGCALAVRGETGPALEQFLELVTRSRKFGQDAGRRAMLTLFDQPGIDDELVRDFRRRLQIVT